MPEHTFALILRGDVDRHIDELFEAGCDDATFGEIDGVPYAEFDREAPTLAEAIASAIRDVETVGGLQVMRVEPDDLVTAAEIAGRLGRTRESVRLLIKGARGPGGFPPPVARVSGRNRLWRWADVAAWAGKKELADELGDAQFVAALNSSLELRHRLPQLEEPERAFVIASGSPRNLRDTQAPPGEQVVSTSAVKPSGRR